MLKQEIIKYISRRFSADKGRRSMRILTLRQNQHIGSAKISLPRGRPAGNFSYFRLKFEGYERAYGIDFSSRIDGRLSKE